MSDQTELKRVLIGKWYSSVVIDNFDRVYTYTHNTEQILVMDDDLEITYIDDIQNDKDRWCKLYINNGLLVYANYINHYYINTN
jgi:hypothetical protein